jgi:flagellar biosynthesis/type III secretory pathway protein FliH
VARAFSCQKAFLNKIKIDDSLMNNVKSCLDIMESHMDAPGSTARKRKKSVEPVVVDPAAPVEEPAPAKRRRGRPSKKVKEQEADAATAAPQGEASEVASPEDAATPPTASHARVRRRSHGSGSSNGKKRSLQQLVQRFEVQYEEMGERYRDMGETLKALKSKIVENRDTMEQEIRDELLQEVQKTIMSGYPKKG